MTAPLQLKPEEVEELESCYNKFYNSGVFKLIADWRTHEQQVRTLIAEREEMRKEIERLRLAKDEANDIIARIWRQLGSPSYDELAGRSIYDCIDELKYAARP